MYRIDSETAIVSIPTPQVVGPNPDSFFTNGNPQAGLPGTNLSSDWCNAVQEELCNVIEGAGLTLDKTDRTQLADAISLMIGTATSIPYGASATAPNTYAVTTSPAITTLYTGTIIFVTFSNANTAAATLNVNSIGVKDIVRNDLTALNANDIGDGMLAALIYDGTRFILVDINYENLILKSNLQNDSYNYSTDTGAANAYVATLSPVPSGYTAGMRVSLKIANTNTAASTLNVNGLGVKNIKLTTGGAIGAQDLIAGQVAHFVYDGTNFQLLNPFASTIYYYSADTGAANAYVTSITVPQITGNRVAVKITTANTTASTLNVGSGATAIKFTDGSALIAGALVAGQIANFIFDGTNWQLLNPAAFTPTYWVDTGSANTYTVAVGKAPVTGQVLAIKILTANTGASTLNIGVGGALAIKLVSGAALVAGNLIAGQIAEFAYDGTNWQLLNPASSTGSYWVDTGTANTYAIAVNQAAVTGQILAVKILNTNTGASTLNIGVGGAVAIKLTSGAALIGGELLATHIALVVYDGTVWQLLNPADNQVIVKMAHGASENLSNGASTTIPLDTTIPQISEGTEIGTIVYTPKSATNILNITATFHLLSSVAGANVLMVAMFKDAGVNALIADSIWTNTTNDHGTVTLIHSMVAGQTTAMTLRFRAGGNSGGAWQTFGGTSWNFGLAAPGHVVIEEYTP